MLIAASGCATTEPRPTPAPQASPAPPATASPTLVAQPSATPPPSIVPFPASMQLSVPSRNVVWALVGSQALFRSTDHGDTWMQRPLPVTSPSLEQAFVSERDGYVMAVPQPGTQCTFQEVDLWRTADAGATYDRMPAAGISQLDCKSGLSFIDAQRGFLSSWSPKGPPYVYRTADGGRSWVRSQPLPDPPGFSTQPAASTMRIGPAPIRAFGSTLLLQAFGNVLSGQRHFVYRSVDAGETWSLLASVPIPTPLGFVTATRWIQPRAPGQSQETMDAGQSWHVSAANYGQAAPTPPVVTFADAEIGYAAGSRGGLQRTLDGGLMWMALRSPGCC